MSILDTSIFSRIRRNHGLEHATINILSRRSPYRRLGGFSDPNGFYILGDVSTDQVRQAVHEALSRLSAGQKNLAIHSGCGTNVVVSGFVAGLLSWAGMIGAKTTREKVGRLPLVILLNVIGFILSQPLGPKVQQRITTSGNMEEMSVKNVFPLRYGKLALHRVLTQP